MQEDEPRARDAASVPPGSGVTFVMPVLNEEAYLARAVASVLAQDIDGPLELILALGPSTDGTDAIARALAEDDPRVRLVANPEADIPVGVNRAIRAGIHPTVVRVDAHSALEPGYAHRALQTLDRTRAANVGGVMRAEGQTPFQRAVAGAYNSPIGLGGGAYHSGGEEGPAESAYLGVMRRAVLEEVGLFDESLRRGEDWELNLRIRRAGYRVWFDPALSVTYWPRDNWAKLARQFRSTGTWRGELVRRYGRRNSVRFFAPPALVLVVAAAVIVALLHITGVLGGLWALAASVVYVPLVAYAVLMIGYVCSPAAVPGVRERAWTLVVLPTMHLAWGMGFVIGALRGARENIDTSRLQRNTPLP
ncbi:glycosyltransferase family 2 protein [uncultured Microbacterium sp.]|uniref:glycosyltransferase family 2 protein n=1 Tax=uncultured Microbacterium sp. TaxID=191216 RepID=UPI00261689CC|nr:glycosyltransferase family 2 protein [uncultured Microbacterium sp.]